MNEQQKLIKRQKGEIKRFNNENDNQRRTLSRFQGIRRFTMQATDNTKACQTDTLIIWPRQDQIYPMKFA